MTETTKKTATNDVKARLRQHKFTFKSAPLKPDGSIDEKNEKEISVTEQFPGRRQAVSVLDDSRGTAGVVRESNFLDAIFARENNILIEPQTLGWDYFDTHTGLDDFYLQTLSFLQN